MTFSGFTLQNAQKGISINSSNNSITNNIVADVSYWSIELNGTGNYLEGNLVKDQGSWGEERQPRGIFLYGATYAKPVSYTHLVSNKRSGRLIAVLLAMCMILGSGPMVILAQAGTDIEGHWAEQVIGLSLIHI